jgi:hypothetical protein
VADDRYWSRTVVIDVRFSLYLAAILDLVLFRFLPTHAEKLVIDRSISTGAANIGGVSGNGNRIKSKMAAK